MATVFDYLKWRGDLSFAQDPLNPVDGLIFCALSYIPFVGQAETPNEPIALRDAAADFLSLDDYESRVRAKNDAMMLRAAAETARFGGCKMVLYRDQFAPEEETQFAAMTFLLPDDTAFVAFRGTDRSLVGWKEDFNMAFQEAVPAQLLEKIQSQFWAACCDDARAAEIIGRVYKEDGYLCDPHTASGWAAAEDYVAETGDNRPMVVLSTASPYKFPRSVLEALGHTAPQNDFEAMQELEEATGRTAPASLTALRQKAERFNTVIDPEQIAQVALSYQE